MKNLLFLRRLSRLVVAGLTLALVSPIFKDFAPVHAGQPAPKDLPSGNKIFGYEKFEDLIRTNPSFKSPDDILPLLPADCRTHYSLMHHSRSLQGSDWVNPRIILNCDGGKLLLSFAGDSSQLKGNEIEVIRFDPEKKFKTVKVSFDSGPKIEENPAECVKCHGSPTKPIWDSYDLWPGAYGSSGGLMFKGSEENRRFVEFLKKHEGKKDRYAFLESLYDPLHKSTQDTPYLLVGKSGGVVEPNSLLGIDVSKLNIEHVLAQLQSLPAYKNESYGLLASLVGCSPILDFFTEPKRSTIKNATAPSADEMVKSAQTYFYDRLNRQGDMAFAPGSKKPRPAVDPQSPTYIGNSETDGRGRVNFEARSYKFRHPFAQLMASYGIDIRDWYLTRERGSYDSQDGVNGLEFGVAYHIAKGLGSSDPKIRALLPLHSVDAGSGLRYEEIDLSKVFNSKPLQSFSDEEKQEFQKSSSDEIIENFQKGPICQYLKYKSLEAQGAPKAVTRSTKDCIDCNIAARSAAQRQTAPSVDPAISLTTKSIFSGKQIIEQRCTDCHSELQKLLDAGSPKLFGEVLRRIRSTDPDVQMPRGDSLSKDEKASVETYIQGLIAK